MAVWTFIYLLLAGTIAGLLSTMAGLASLISYPVLLSLGVPPVNANVTNTAALIFTGAGATLSSRRELWPHKRMTFGVTIWALLGGLAGSLILVVAPAKTFTKVVPFLIAMAGGLMLQSTRRGGAKRPTFASRLGTLTPWRRRLALGLRNGAIFLVGLYIGYFGASAGIIMLAILSVTLGQKFAVANAIKNFASFATNIFSLLIYALNTRVYWGMALIMGLGFFIGGFLGPIVVRHIPVRPLKLIVAYLAFGLAAYFFYTAYF